MRRYLYELPKALRAIVVEEEIQRVGGSPEAVDGTPAAMVMVLMMINYEIYAPLVFRTHAVHITVTVSHGSDFSFCCRLKTKMAHPELSHSKISLLSIEDIKIRHECNLPVYKLNTKSPKSTDWFNSFHVDSRKLVPKLPSTNFDVHSS